jgi:hypothetical protein
LTFLHRSANLEIGILRGMKMQGRGEYSRTSFPLSNAGCRSIGA